MLFNSYKPDTVAKIIFDGYFVGSLCFGLVSLFGFFSGSDVLAVLSGLVYFGVSAFLSLSKNFRKSPFALLLCIFSFQFLNIPITFILLQGQSYIYGTGLVSLPYEQGDYQQSLSLGILYLTCFWAAIWLGIVLAGKGRRIMNKGWKGSISLRSILFLGFGVMMVTWIDNSHYADIRLNEGSEGNSVPAFIFFDHAYLVLAGMLLLFKLNDTDTIENSRKISFSLSVIYIGSVFVYFMAGSKAAILVMFNLLVLYPFCIFVGSDGLKIQFLKPVVILSFALLAFPMFYFALTQRLSLESGIPPTLDTLLAGVSELDGDMVAETFSQIMYRFAQGGIDRFLLIFQSFIVHDFNWETSGKLVVYLWKGALNILLPGTPFPESYAPSAQFFPEIIANKDFVGDLSLSEFIQNSNTQPFTLFGIFILIFGVFSPIFLFLGTFFFVSVFNKLGSSFLRMTMIYFFAAALSSFGIETVVGNSAHLLVSIVLMYGILRIYTELTSVRLRRLTDLPPKNRLPTVT